MKKILAVLLAVAMVATLAVSSVMTASAGNEPQIVVSEATATKGATTDITISLKNNPGVASIKVKVNFPSDLTLDKVTFNKALNTTDSEGTPTSQTSKPKVMTSPATLNWVSNSQNVEGDIVYATLQFTVSAEATEGDKEISLTADPEDLFAYVSGSYDEQDLVEGNVPFELVAGKITVVACLHEHTTQVAAVASTCKTAGHGAYTKCDDCGAIIEGSDAALDLDPTNHEGGTEVQNAKAASCSEEGYTGDTVCKGCGATIKAGEPIKTTDHTPSDWKSDSASHWKECTVCTQVIGESESHNFEEKVLEEATTEKEGKKAKVCKVCGYVDEESTVTIPKLDSYDAEQVAGDAEKEEAVYDAEAGKAVGYKVQVTKDKLAAVKVNGQVVDAANYEVSEDDQGNTVVTFKEDYLKTLDNGNYTVTLSVDKDGDGAEDGVAQTVFTVKNKAANNNAGTGTQEGTGTSSKTGDMDIALLIFALIAMMGASVFAGVAYRKKTNR
ncbi:MAG: hypothetical protein IKZ47_06845 [Clostridia bacterium]|nr:hypothetical protein [Clostridia bacterium]